jgi:hypothetical protein
MGKFLILAALLLSVCCRSLRVRRRCFTIQRPVSQLWQWNRANDRSRSSGRARFHNTVSSAFTIGSRTPKGTR